MDDLQQLPQEVHERMILYLKLKLDITAPAGATAAADVSSTS